MIPLYRCGIAGTPLTGEAKGVSALTANVAFTEMLL